MPKVFKAKSEKKTIVVNYWTNGLCKCSFSDVYRHYQKFAEFCQEVQPTGSVNKAIISYRRSYLKSRSTNGNPTKIHLNVQHLKRKSVVLGNTAFK